MASVALRRLRIALSGSEKYREVPRRVKARGGILLEYVLEMRSVDKSFPGAKVLKNVSLQIKKGEVHALMGENGAGKSTLMKILMGVYSSDAGEILLNGLPVNISNPHEAMGLGISMIHQELNPILDMQVFENVYIGRELRNALGIADKRRMKSETKTLLESLDIYISPTSHMRELSVAQCQLIEIAKAISVGARVIIMDEPTSAITDREIDTLFTQILRLKNQGVAIIYISHKMDEIFRVCDAITVLRDGELIGTDDTANLDKNKLIKMMVGRDITEVYPKSETAIGEVVLEARNICLGSRVKNVGFQLRRGEILGIAGLVGAGRSELVEAIFGVTKRDSGEVLIGGAPCRIKSPKDAIARKLALITEDRKMTGLNLVANIAENITQVAIKTVSSAGILSRRREHSVADEYIDKLSIRATGRDQMAGNLSGGNQQKVVVAKWLLSEPEIIILDEPTRGIDVGAKRDIYLLIGELVKAGKAVLVISSEIPEIMGLCDRIIVMAEGRVTGELERKEFSQETIMAYAADFETALERRLQ
jgi:ABC-type sugar transport system ATPase subunit